MIKLTHFLQIIFINKHGQISLVLQLLTCKDLLA